MLFYIEFPKSQTQVSERDRGILDFDSNYPTFGQKANMFGSNCLRFVQKLEKYALVQ